MSKPITAASANIKCVTVTRSLARKWLSTVATEREDGFWASKPGVRQRKLTKSGQEAFQKRFDSNRYREGIALFGVMANGFLGDGQNRLAGFLLSKKDSFKAMVNFSFEPADQICADTGRSRTGADAIKVVTDITYHNEAAALAELAMRIIRRKREGGAWDYTRGDRIDKDVLAKWVKTNKSVVEKYAKMGKGPTVTGRYAAALAAINDIYGDGSIDSEAFVAGVVHGLGLGEEHDPRHRIRGKMLQNRDDKRYASNAASECQLMHWHIEAWNKWATRTPMKRLNPTTTPPALILSIG